MPNLDLEKEIEAAKEPPTVGLCLNRKARLELLIWTQEYEPNHFLLIAKLVKNGTVYRSWADAVRDYIDMTHLRNWILRDCEDIMDSDGLELLLKFMQRYKYERRAKIHHNHLACEVEEMIR